MPWIGERVRDDAVLTTYAAVEELAEWSEWRPFDEGIAEAPRLPGVYVFREPDTQLIRYAGMAGERAGGGRAQGLHGRLAVFLSGKDAVGGFGEAALDRALADEVWVEEQLSRLRRGAPRRARQWAADAVERLQPELSWAGCYERADALVLDARVVELLRPHGLWNR